MNDQYPLAPDLQVSGWLNSQQPLLLSSLKGKVVVIHAFQMLCPGCVSHGLPQTKMIHERFASLDLQVLGLHSVFEHHSVMNKAALEAFVSEYRIAFPVAIDQPSKTGPIPLTMNNYRLEGTPSLILIDRNGGLRLKHFGRLDDLMVGKLIGELLAEEHPSKTEEAKRANLDPKNMTSCGEQVCSI